MSIERLGHAAIAASRTDCATRADGHAASEAVKESRPHLRAGRDATTVACPREDTRLEVHVQARDAESGYAMLLVFAMSAMIAIGLYQQLPRAAFEAQREKEQLLIDHGEQYKRAFQLYYRKLSRYPSKMEDLENTQSIRFLRKRFVDPMTGKDEWRLVHMGAGGQLVDSLVKTQKKDDQWHNTSITEFKPAGQDTGGEEGVNLAVRRRPSDDMTPGAQGGNPPPLPMNTDPSSASPVQPAPGLQAGIPGSPIQPPGMLGGGGGAFAQPNYANQRYVVGPNGQLLPAGSAANNGQNGSQSSVGGNGGFGSSVGGNGGYANPGTPAPVAANPFQAMGGLGPGAAPVNSQFQGVSPQNGYQTTQGSNQPNNGFPQPGQQMTPAQMINNLITGPRPGGPPAGINSFGTPNNGTPGGTTVGGLAGVASNHKGHAIHVYNEQDEYQKWEFYYDITKDITNSVRAAGAVPNQQGAQQGQNGALGTQPGLNNGIGTGSSFGTTPGSPSTGSFQIGK